MTENTNDAEGLGPAAILVILVLGSILTLLLWTTLSRNRDLAVERETQGYASAIAEVIERALGSVMASTRRRAHLWATPAFATSGDTWREDVEIFLAENPALMGVLRADSNWAMAGSTAGKQILREVLPEARRNHAQVDGEFVAGPFTVADGRTVFGLQVRASSEPTDKRTVFCVFDARQVISGVIENRALGFGLAVHSGEHELYRRLPAEGGDPLPKSNAIRTGTIAIPTGNPWTLEIWPEPGSPLLSAEQGPAIALAGGLLFSALIAAAVHYGTLAWRRERVLRRVNAILEGQIDDTRRGQGEMRELSAALEARVAERTAELHETIVELETFNYSVSHDLRGPLGAVINFAAILQEDYADQLDATARDHLERIVGSASKAVSMMDALLAYSRSGRTELRKTHLDMQRVVREVCDEIATNAPRLACAVKIGDLPTAFADENMMRFVFANLIGNACKFARSDDTTRVEVGGNLAANEIAYFVRDEGIGFDMRFAEKLFHVFERLHVADGYEGYGVGLAIVARMVRRHGGRVWAQGAVGKGATFYFTVATTGAERNGRSAG
jgi:signal transduction histidine kinase